MKEKNKITGFSTMSSAVEFAAHYNQWVFSKFQKYIGGNILEVGSGKGIFKKWIKPSDLFVSVDIDKDIIDNAKRKDPDGIYFNSDIADKNTVFLLKKHQFRSILCFNVLEHIEEDGKAIENMLELLDENGYLLLFAPALPLLFNDKDKLAGHLRRYTKKSLLNKLKLHNNIEIKKLEYFNPIGAIGYLANKFVKHRSLNNKSIRFQTQFFDKYLVSLSKAINPITVNLFGQSLVCVVQKKKNQ